MKILKNEKIHTLPETVDDIQFVVIEDGNSVRRVLQRTGQFPDEDRSGIPVMYKFDRSVPTQIQFYPTPDRDLTAGIVGVREVLL